jgi:hypothetical protein
MGQYFVILNLDREEYLDPNQFGEGLKLFEFCGLTMAGLTVLLTHEADGYFDQGSALLGAWAGQRVVIAGDEAATAGDYLSDDQLRRLQDALAEPERRSPWLLNSAHLFARHCCQDISEPLLLAMCHCPFLRENIEEVLQRGGFLLSEPAYRERVRRELECAASAGS